MPALTLASKTGMIMKHSRTTRILGTRPSIASTGLMVTALTLASPALAHGIMQHTSSSTTTDATAQMQNTAASTQVAAYEGLFAPGMIHAPGHLIDPGMIHAPGH